MPLDAIDKRILDIIQSYFPLSSHPYEDIGQELGLTENEVFSHVQALRQSGIIRRIGANFQSAKLGFRSTLCAAKVPLDQIKAFTAEVNRYTGVTHNYLRDDPTYNIWFSFIGTSWEAICSSLNEISQKTGIKILNLPATRLYKIRVDFPME